MRRGTVRMGSLRDAVLSKEDQRMLSRLIQRATELEEADEETPKGLDVKAFEDMLAKNRPLTDKQRAWVNGIYDRVFDEPQYSNLASSGRLCVGRPVALLLPENLPKKPPTPRRTGDAEEK